MIELGKLQKLIIVKIEHHGAYLALFDEDDVCAGL